MGLENSDSRIAPGLIQASNLVPGQQDYSIGSKAVANMREAMKDGFITANEIGERFSQREGLKKQVQTQQLKNALAQQNADAPLIQPRADLAGAQINAQTQLVPKEAAVASGSADQALWQQNIATSLHSDQAASALTKTKQDLENIRSYGNNDTIQKQLGEYGLTVPFNPSTGEPDWERAKRQAEAIAQSKFEIAQRMAMIKGVSLKDVSHPGQQPGSTVTRPVAFDAVGRVFDPDKQTFRSFQDIKAGNTAAPGAAQPAPANNPAPLIQSKGAAANTEDVPIQPKGQADFSQGDEGVSYNPGEAPDKKASGLREEMAKDKRIVSFQEAAPQFEQLLLDEQKLNSKTPEEWRADPGAMRAFDMHLAFNYFKVLHPETRVTEQNFNEVEHLSPNAIGEDGQPLGAGAVNAVKDVVNQVLKRTTLTPTGRQELINEGKSAFQGYVNAAKPVLDGYSKEASRQNLPPESVILPQWQKLLNSAAPASKGAPAASGKPVKIKSVDEIKNLPPDVKQVEFNGRVYTR